MTPRVHSIPQSFAAEIDFLPQEYRLRALRKRRRHWRIVAAAAISMLMVSVAVEQRLTLRRLRADAAAVAPLHEACEAQNRQLAAAQAELRDAETSAELFTVLRCRWPASQLIAAVLQPLPPGITFEQLRLERESATGPAVSESHSRRETARESAQKKEVAPAQRDLDHFLRQEQQTRTVVRLTGLTDDPAALHRYLGELDESPLVRTATLESLEGAEVNGATSTRFRINLLVSPGVGLFGDPSSDALAAGGGREALDQGRESR
ncbi:MAG: hypothetical protein ACOY3P_01375 [Planctomycetota bacterium]